MKIRVLSDLHLEFFMKSGTTYNIVPMEDDHDTTLVLAGDIVCHDMIDDILHDFLEKCSKQFKHVVYITGNHEFYYGDIKKTPKKIVKMVKKFNNVHFLDNSSVVLDDFLFIGSMLWTNFDNDETAIGLARFQISDFLGIISNGRRDFFPEDSIAAYKKSERYIRKMVKENPDKKIVLVTHFLPSLRSIAPRFYGSKLNSYFATSLLDYPGLEGINLAIHGHTHIGTDYMIGKTRVMCNPHGYFGREERTIFDHTKIVEI